ncbi:MAG: hypothetical protein U0U66_13205 [Cytophagaceae bacterium]
MKKILLFITIISLLFACREGEKGEQGPAGLGYFKSGGTTSGTIHYKYENGDTAIVPYTYTAYSSVLSQTYYLDTAYGNSYYSVNIERNDPDEPNNYITFYICDAFYNKNANSASDAFTQPTSMKVFFNYVKSSNPFFHLSNEYNYSPYPYTEGFDLTITNYNLNPTTGKLTFDYEIVVDPDHIPYDLRYDDMVQPTLKGSINVNLTKSPYNNSSCANDYPYSF